MSKEMYFPITNSTYKEILKGLGVIEESDIGKPLGAKDFVDLLSGGNTRGLRNGMLMNYNYTNSDGVEVTFKDDGVLLNFNGIEVVGDVELDGIFITDPSKRNKGLASKELDRIIREADKLGMAITLTVDSETASIGIENGLSDTQLKAWYQSRGFIFNNSFSGYRPSITEDPSKLIINKVVWSEEVQKKFERVGSLEANGVIYKKSSYSNPKWSRLNIIDGYNKVVDKNGDVVIRRSKKDVDLSKIPEFLGERPFKLEVIPTKYEVEDSVQRYEVFKNKSDAINRIEELNKDLEEQIYFVDVYKGSEHITGYINLKQAIGV